MILLNRLKYGLFLVFNKMIISLFVVSSFAIADNQVKILTSENEKLINSDTIKFLPDRCVVGNAARGDIIEVQGT